MAALVFALFSMRWMGEHRRAADVLRRFAGQSPNALSIADRAVDEFDEVSAAQRVRLRWYIPRRAASSPSLFAPRADAPPPPGLVLVHGIHRLGIDEPRLVRFARALAGNGVAVLTPEVQELKDYRVDPRSIATIGAAAHALHAKVWRKVGIMGMSFAGGLSLLAASDPQFASDIGMVVAVGAHDDAARVARFFATSRIARPDGSTASFEAHGYGVLVFAYAHAERFFSPEDLPIAQGALATWLAEDRDRARALAMTCTAPCRELLTRLFEHHLDEVAAPFLDAVDADEEGLSAISPRGRIGALRVPIFLLHGAGDSVIPPSETEWLAQDVPRRELRDVLISRALVHVEPGGQPTWYEQWELLHFIADVLSELDDLSP